MGRECPHKWLLWGPRGLWAQEQAQQSSASSGAARALLSLLSPGSGGILGQGMAGWGVRGRERGARRDRGRCSWGRGGDRRQPRALPSPRLGRTKAAVQAALAHDFDTVRAVDAAMDLVHHGNRQLKAAC